MDEWLRETPVDEVAAEAEADYRRWLDDEYLPEDEWREHDRANA